MAKPKSLPPPQKLPDFSFFQALRPTRRAFCFALENEKGRFQNGISLRHHALSNATSHTSRDNSRHIWPVRSESNDERSITRRGRRKRTKIRQAFHNADNAPSLLERTGHPDALEVILHRAVGAEVARVRHVDEGLAVPFERLGVEGLDFRLDGGVGAKSARVMNQSLVSQSWTRSSYTVLSPLEKVPSATMSMAALRRGSAS